MLKVEQLNVVSRVDAERIATDHVSHYGIGHPDYQVGWELLGRFGGQWLFEYHIRGIAGASADQQERLAVAGGFVVSSGGNVRMISKRELLEFELQLEEATGGE